MSINLATQTTVDSDLADFVSRESAERERAIADLRLRYEGRTISKDDKESYELVRIGIRELVSLRTSIEKRRVALGADALNWKRRVDSEAKRLTALVEEIEEPLRAAKQVIDDEKARIKREAEEAERAAIEANIRLEREQEEARQRAEQERISEQHRLEREQLEKDRAILATQRAEIEAQQKAERDRITAELAAERANAEAQRKAIEAERQAVRAERDRMEREDFERKAKTRAEQKARELAQLEQEQAELRRLETERRAAEESKRIAELKPDKEKVGAFAAALKTALKTVHMPTVTAKEAIAVLQRAINDIKRVLADCESFSNP